MNHTAPKSDYKSRRDHPPVVAWKIREGLCHWAEPSSERLRARSKPSPEATVTRCRLVPIADYKAMLAAWRREQK